MICGHQTGMPCLGTIYEQGIHEFQAKIPLIKAGIRPIIYFMVHISIENVNAYIALSQFGVGRKAIIWDAGQCMDKEVL